MAWSYGIDFKAIKGVPRDRILQGLAGKVDLQTRRRAISRCLVGNDVLKAIELSHHPSVSQSHMEEELLFECLLKWCEDAETATGAELLEVLKLSGCGQQLLSEMVELLRLSQPQSFPPAAVGHSWAHQTAAASLNVRAELLASGLLTHPHGRPFAAPDLMSEMQMMIKTTMSSFHNSTMETLTTTLDEMKEGFAALEARQKQLENKMQHSTGEVNYQCSKLTQMIGKKAWCQAVYLTDKLVVIGGFKNATQPCTRVFIFQIMFDTWYEYEPTPYALSSAVADADGRNMFVIGGCPETGGAAVSQVFMLSSDMQNKTVIPDMIYPCCRAASAILQGQIYVLGGERSWYHNESRYGCNGPHSLQILDLHKKAWMLGPELMRDNPWLDCYRLVSLGSLLICDKRHVLDIEEKVWRDLPHRPSGFSTAMSVVDDRLLVFGGDHGVKHVHQLNEDMQQWTKVGDLMTARRHAAACTDDKSVYIIGGQLGDQYFDTIEKFTLV